MAATRFFGTQRRQELLVDPSPTSADTIEIKYEPNERLIELKSLKLYFSSYRNTEILHEEIANKILDDFIKAVEPRWVMIEVKVNVRGGIYTTIKRYWSKEKGDELEKISRLNNLE